MIWCFFAFQNWERNYQGEKNHKIDQLMDIAAMRKTAVTTAIVIIVTLLKMIL